MNHKLSDIINTAKFIVISTICADGAPWATPLGLFAFDAEKNQIVFQNRAGTTHAENLARDDRCFITLVNYDEENQSRTSLHISTFAKKLTGENYEKAKNLIQSRGKNISSGDIFAAPLGKKDEAKSTIDLKRNTTYIYMKSEEEK